MKRLTAGVVGLGLGWLHAKAYLDNPGIERLVVCDPDAARLDRLRAEFPSIAAAYIDIGAMLAAERLDIVSVVTPDHLHRANAEQCLAGGCHVLLTKPMATTRNDAMAIVAAGRRSGRRLMVAQEARYRARFQTLQRLIAEGYFGEIISLRLDSIWDKREHFAKSPWYASVEADRSLMTGTAVHEVDLMRFLLGRPAKRVFASGNHLGDLVFPREKTVVATIDFNGGCIGQVGASYVARWPKTGEIADPLRIIGTVGMAVGDRYCRDGEADWNSVPAEGNTIVDGTSGCVSAFVEAILGDTEVPVTGEDAFASLDICFAADQSVASGEPVWLDDTRMRHRA